MAVTMLALKQRMTRIERRHTEIERELSKVKYESRNVAFEHKELTERLTMLESISKSSEHFGIHSAWWEEMRAHDGRISSLAQRVNTLEHGNGD